MIKASNKSDSALTSQGIQITERGIFLQEHRHSIFTQVRLHVSKRPRLHQHEKIWPHAHTRLNRRAGYTVRELTAARLHGSRRATLTRFSRLKYVRSLKPATAPVGGKTAQVQRVGGSGFWAHSVFVASLHSFQAHLKVLSLSRSMQLVQVIPRDLTLALSLSLLVHILQSWTIRTC